MFINPSPAQIEHMDPLAIAIAVITFSLWAIMSFGMFYRYKNTPIHRWYVIPIMLGLFILALLVLSIFDVLQTLLIMPLSYLTARKWVRPHQATLN